MIQQQSTQLPVQEEKYSRYQTSNHDIDQSADSNEHARGAIQKKETDCATAIRAVRLAKLCSFPNGFQERSKIDWK